MKTTTNHINQIPLFDSSRINSGPRIIYADTTSGFFALSNLKTFCCKRIDQVIDTLMDTEVIFDFSSVKLWDISAILWLAVALRYYRSIGLRYYIKLPEPMEHMRPGDVSYEELLKSADFLRRWNFKTILESISSINDLMVPSQVSYFDNGPEKYYKDDSYKLTTNGLEKLLSNRLFSIRDLTAKSLQSSFVDHRIIADCINEFSKSTEIKNIISSHCLPTAKDYAGDFAFHLVGESLLNVEQHPNATMAYISIAILGSSKEMILSVVDNGDSILKTILPVYNKRTSNTISPECLDKLPPAKRSEILHFATLPNVSSKPFNDFEEIGLGLTYLKEDTIQIFQGKFRIISGSTQVIYSKDPNEPPEFKNWPHIWPGNLIRISIPLK